MKVVLNRKGFDSANGGIMSLIFEGGTMVSFPIPNPGHKTADGRRCCPHRHDLSIAAFRSLWIMEVITYVKHTRQTDGVAQ